MLMSGLGQAPADFLVQAAVKKVTHISGTPSHWRRVLMSKSARRFTPKYIRLSGEIADQAILDSLRTFFPNTPIVHAFASTEAGVAFEVGDGLAGFPASLLDREDGSVRLRVRDGSLRIRSPRTALRYLGNVAALCNEDGFVDTGDMIEQHGDRCYFVGRREGIINVGGLKVHPEEVEAVINRHPRIQLSRVGSRKSPITGAIVVADIVLRTPLPDDTAPFIPDWLKTDIADYCRKILPPHKVPSAIRIVPSLEIAPSGKLVRTIG
jgi:acyl-CoA synthetase (AMP-forming)/AMP-acid ligase II